MSVCHEKDTRDTANSKNKNKYKGLKSLNLKIKRDDECTNNAFESYTGSNTLLESDGKSSTGNSIIYRNGQ